MTDWADVLRQLEPNYDRLKTMAELGPSIRAVIKKVNLSWRVRLEEDWDDELVGEVYYTADYQNLDKRCEWASEQLVTWSTATRLSHQEWKFSTQTDAEKFITLFNLKWAYQ